MFRISDSGFRVSGSGLRVSSFGFRVLGFGFRVSGFGLRRTLGGTEVLRGAALLGGGVGNLFFGFWVSGFGFRVSVLSFSGEGGHGHGSRDFRHSWGLAGQRFECRIQGLKIRGEGRDHGGFGFRNHGFERITVY